MPAKWDWGVTRIAWLDAETTGVARPWAPPPLLLEVALVVTDGALQELGRYEAVIRHEQAVLDGLSMPPVVLDMHTKNGLLDALRGPDTVPMDEAEKAMIDLLDRFDVGQPIVWGGFSPSAVDRPVVGQCMPTYYGKIHYRSLDMSTIKLALKNWGGVDLEGAQLDRPVGHRAMSDVLESVETAKIARRLFALTGAERIATVIETVEASVGSACG